MTRSSILVFWRFSGMFQRYICLPLLSVNVCGGPCATGLVKSYAVGVFVTEYGRFMWRMES
jgi:hypothetical protein